MTSDGNYHLRLRRGDLEIEISGDREWVESFWNDEAIRSRYFDQAPELPQVPGLLDAGTSATGLLEDEDVIEAAEPRGSRRRAPGAGSLGRKRRVQRLIEPPLEHDRYTSAIRVSADHKARVFLALLLARELYKLDGLSMAEILQVLSGRCGLKLHRSSLDASLKRVEGGFEKIRPRWSNQVRLYRLTPEGEQEARRFLAIAEVPVPTAAESAQFGLSGVPLQAD